MKKSGVTITRTPQMGINSLLVSQAGLTGTMGSSGGTIQDMNPGLIPNTAQSLYGYAVRKGGYLPEGPVLTDVASTREINTSATGKTVGGMNLVHHALGWQNPLFWVLILALVIVGYLTFLFDIGVKNVGKEKLELGHKD
jgi:hypothetical protein